MAGFFNLMKKIAFISDSIYPYNKGGKEKRLLDVSMLLSKRGWNVHIYTMKWWKGEDVRQENGVTLHAISKLYPLYAGDRRSIKEGVLFGLACFKLIGENWDVIDVDHMPFFPLFSTKIVCILKHKKMVATWHEVWGASYWKKYMGNMGIISYFIEKMSIYMPNTVISVSNHTTKMLKNILKMKASIVTATNGINIDEIKKIKPSKTKSDVIYAGRLLTHKNIEILVRAISILRDKNPKIKALIIGDGPERKNIAKLIKSKKLTKNIKLIKFIESHAELYSLMKSSRVFALPSTREGFSLVAAESFAANIPVVTTNHPQNAASDLIQENKNGITINLNEKEMARAIEKLMKTKKRDYTKYAEKYSWNNIIPKIERVYNSL